MRYCFLVLLAIFIACGTSKKESPELHEAGEIHEQAMAIEKDMKAQFEQLVQIKNSINVQGRMLTAAEIAFVEQVEAIESSYHFWEENHVEVPGHEHGEHEHADQDHDHAAKLELTPTDMLAVQREFRDSIVVIKQRVEMALQTAKTIGNR
ncbi:MAG: hypothetical protein SFU99_03705 [Saprospiraceae bacterium]|nr:hypothetical protein [Saprospiraceae bacterium]